ncbi:MAG: 50S ribosomal protein L13 [Anaerolineae bacterium]|nr:50S ribosomal protein L13 [Thermoflexales bacterium]MDW8408473.1 50S ribosomal protein L13 [Anaerolineae bacterium]
MAVTNKTYTAKPNEVLAGKAWYVVDAEGKTLGRLATKIAKIIMGKHKPIYTPSLDCGDFVIVVNASKIKVTGNRMTEKKYYRHSMYTGAGLKEESLQTVLAKRPERVIRQAVWGMIPHGRLGRKMITKLKVYGGSEHPHAAQQPINLEL